MKGRELLFFQQKKVLTFLKMVKNSIFRILRIFPFVVVKMSTYLEELIRNF